jgi:hypothetical protein
MLTVVWNPHGFHVIKVLPRGCKWTSQCYIDNILPEIWLFTLQEIEESEEFIPTM